MEQTGTVKIVIFVLISLGLLICLGLAMTRPISPSVEGLESVFRNKSYTAFLIETILKTTLAAFVTALINYFLFKKTVRKISKRNPFLFIWAIHIVVAIVGCMPYIKMVSDNIY